jgi:prepilin-type N-terminal cleavage/methylation domain-containing protein
MYKRLKNRKGFTIIELLIVVSVLAIMAAVAIPNVLSWMLTIRVNSAVRELASEMQLARMKAVSERNNYVITFDISNNQYKIYDDDDNDGAETSELQKTVDIDADYKGIQFGHVSTTGTSGDTILNEVTFTGTPRSVVFKPDGTANKNGSVFIIPTEDIADSKDARQRAITVIQTGRVKLWKHDGSNWN